MECRYKPNEKESRDPAYYLWHHRPIFRVAPEKHHIPQHVQLHNERHLISEETYMDFRYMPRRLNSFVLKSRLREYRKKLLNQYNKDYQDRPMIRAAQMILSRAPYFATRKDYLLFHG